MDFNVWILFIGFRVPVRSSCERGSEHLERNFFTVYIPAFNVRNLINLLCIATRIGHYE
jgi:hypothetical protein